MPTGSVKADFSERKEEIAPLGASPDKTARPETPSTPEQAGEKPARSDQATLREVRESLEPATAAEGPAIGAGSDPRLAARLKQIENILARGVVDFYLAMPPAKQAEFKRAGEETAQEINRLLGEARLKISRIVDLVKRWLSLIPGVNRFFLEQEAKIKTDEIIKLKPNDG